MGVHRLCVYDMELPSADFVKLLVSKIYSWTIHHFVSKTQSKYCRELKSYLNLNECLLQGDLS